jgi:hypothetical protein
MYLTYWLLHTCLLSSRPQVEITATRPALLTQGLEGFPHSKQVTASMNLKFGNKNLILHISNYSDTQCVNWPWNIV